MFFQSNQHNQFSYPNMDMASPVAQVFNTVELLEMILYKLGTKDLLLSQRVSKFWKDVIHKSIKLQQALFMRPVGSHLGPLVLIADESHTIFCQSHVLEKLPMRKNPLIEPLFEQSFYLELHPRDSIMKRLPPSWRHLNASWRRMLLMSPSVLASTGNMLLQRNPISQDASSVASLCMDTGKVRLGDIVKRWEGPRKYDIGVWS